MLADLSTEVDPVRAEYADAETFEQRLAVAVGVLQTICEQEPTTKGMRNTLHELKTRHVAAQQRLALASENLRKQAAALHAFNQDDTVVVDAASYPVIVLTRQLLGMTYADRVAILCDLGLFDATYVTDAEQVKQAVRKARHRNQFHFLVDATAQALAKQTSAR